MERIQFWRGEGRPLLNCAFTIVSVYCCNKQAQILRSTTVCQSAALCVALCFRPVVLAVASSMLRSPKMRVRRAGQKRRAECQLKTLSVWLTV